MIKILGTEKQQYTTHISTTTYKYKITEELYIEEEVTENLLKGTVHTSRELLHIDNNYTPYLIPNYETKLIELWKEYKKEEDYARLLYKFLGENAKELSMDFEEQYSLNDICVVRSQYLLDTEGNPLPRPFSFDYIGTPFHSDCLDLDKAKLKLEQHPWVKEVMGPLWVPRWNQNDKGDLKYLSVIIYPDKQGINDLYTKLKARYKYLLMELREALHDYYEPTSENNILGVLDCVIR
jgi:hypothetical protein